MLKGALIHPELVQLLASCGHGDKVLIADGNYPIESCTSDQTRCVFLNLTHGIPLVTDVLLVLEKSVSIEKAEVMVPEKQVEAPIFKEFQEILGIDVPFESLKRHPFYQACMEKNVKVAIATGEQRLFGNILITVGVV